MKINRHDGDLTQFGPSLRRGDDAPQSTLKKLERRLDRFGEGLPIHEDEGHLMGSGWRSFMGAKTVKFRGKTFPSLRALAEHYGAHYGNLVRRLRTGWTIEQALGLKEGPKRGVAHNATDLVSSIGTFSSIQKAGETTEIKPATIQARLSKGWSVDQALGVEVRERRRRTERTQLTCAGEEFASIAAFADHYGVNRIRTRKRIRSGWTPEQAVGIAPPPPRFRNQDGSARDHAWTGKTVLPDGSVVPATKKGYYRLYVIRNQRNGKEYVGITTNTLKARFRGHWRMVAVGRNSKLYNAMRKAKSEGHKSDFTIELIRNDARDFRDLQEQEIAEIEKRDTVRNGYNTGAGGSIGASSPIEVDGEVFPSRQAAAQFYGIPVSRFNLRLSRLGYTPEEAVGLVKREKYARHCIDMQGQHFSSLQSAAEHFGVNYQRAHERLTKRGWTLEQALELAPPPETTKYVGIAVEVNGVGYRSVQAAAEAHGVKPASVTARMRMKGQSCEEAIESLKKTQRTSR